MLAILKGLRDRQSEKPDQARLNETTRKYLVAQTGRDLLIKQERQQVITKIKRLFSVTETVWINHYLYAIEQFAEIVQEVPASEIHHHSCEGGLIDHTLDTLHAGIRIAHGYILPPNSEPEDVCAAAEKWRFAVFIAILAHDIGKIVTDIEVVYSQNHGEFIYWHPWFGNIPLGARYVYRYKDRKSHSRQTKSLHEKAAMSMLPRLLTKEAANWIFDDTELLCQLFSTITHATFGGQVISEIVRNADGSSVAKNLGADTGVATSHSNSVPLHEKLIVSLRKLINDGDLKRNKPGAAFWVTEKDTWLVSKAGMEAVRAQLVNEGHRGIPKSVVRLFEVLQDHELLVPNPSGESVWICEIDDFAKDWRQTLTFLRFKNEYIWPTSSPDLFDGSITPVDSNGKALPGMSTDGIDPDNPDSGDKEGSSEPCELIMENAEAAPATRRGQEPATKNAIPKASIPAERITLSGDGIDSGEAKRAWKSSRKVQEGVLAQNAFISWLLKGIGRRKIRVNEAKAPVHILESHIAIVTPKIFIQYLNDNPMKKTIYEKRAGGKKIYTLLQRELESLDIHQRGQGGQNIVTMSVEGQRSQSELKVYLLNRDCFSSLKSFSANAVMKIHL